VLSKGWIAAEDLVAGDEVHTLKGDAGTVVGLKFEKLDKPVPVYNIEVEDFHSYFVGGGVLVHNECSSIDEHHSYPVYLGGDRDQLKTALWKEFHQKVIHPLMDKFYPRTAPKGIYKELLDDPKFKDQLHKALVKIYSYFKNVAPDLLKDFERNF
jgi:hypothetical protein